MSWLREITLEVCPICEINYLIRDKHKGSREKTMKIDGIKHKIGKIEKHDYLECNNCGRIRDYDGEETFKFNQENYEKYIIFGSHKLKQLKEKRDRIKTHKIRLSALKKLHNQPSFIIEEEFGKENMIFTFLEGISRACENFKCGLMKYGFPKTQFNSKLLRFLIDKLKSVNKDYSIKKFESFYAFEQFLYTKGRISDWDIIVKKRTEKPYWVIIKCFANYSYPEYTHLFKYSVINRNNYEDSILLQDLVNKDCALLHIKNILKLYGDFKWINSND